MTQSCINLCLLAVISLLFGVIWQGSAVAASAPQIGSLGQISEGLRGPTMLDVDSAGNLYVADLPSHSVIKFDKYGSKIAALTAVQISGAGLAVAADGRVYVSAGNRVAIMNVDGSLFGNLGSGAGEFQFAGNIDFDVNGKIYVVDQTAGRIKVYNPSGAFVGFFGNLQLGGLIGLSIDPQSNLIYIANYNYVSATGLVPNLSIYDADGLLQRKIVPTNGFMTPPVLSFGSIVFDSLGRYYLSDGNGATIRVMDAVSGTPLLKHANGLIHPCAMAFDSLTSRLFVLHADTRVDIYGIDGGVNPVHSNVAPSVPLALTTGELASQSPAVEFTNATDADDDALTYNVQVFDSLGAVVAQRKAIDQSTEATTVATLALGAASENNTYQWQVQADDGLVTSDWSALKTFYINAVQEAPTAPVLTSFLNGETAGSEALLSWDASSDADPFSRVSYRVEVRDDSTLVASGEFAETVVALTELSAGLIPGSPYFWRVIALDNTAREAASLVEGHFVYRPSVLQVKANIPGARVYLGGHHGYVGRALGLAPAEIRNLPAGNYSVVIEASGFLPYVVTVAQVKDSTVAVGATLKGARLASAFASHSLTLAGPALQASDVAPIVADLNQDGILDLLLANGGVLRIYPGVMAEPVLASETIADLMTLQIAAEDQPVPAQVVFSELPVQLSLPQIAGAAPCLVDWDNDDRFDLLIGGADGTVQLFLGQGGLSFSASGELLTTVNGPAVPAVADMDGDGDKDLIVASGTDLLLLDNVGSDAQPVLNTSSTLAVLQGAAAPLFVDWNGDGLRELMLFSSGELFMAELSAGQVSALTSTGVNFADAAQVFALNLTDNHYADLVVGTSQGSLLAVNGQQGDFAPACLAVLQARLESLHQQVASDAPKLLKRVDNIIRHVELKEYDVALLKAQQLLVDLGVSSPASTAAQEFVEILE